MPTDKFDQIVIGAGMAGLCCAGELVRQGKHPLLISETSEVGSMYRTKKIGKSSSFSLQMPTWQLGWGGGWWYQLARALNVPIRIQRGISFNVSLRGSGISAPLALPGSGSGFVSTVTDAFGIPLDRETADQLENVVQEALMMPLDELYTLDRVPFAQWLEEHGAGELVTILLLTIVGMPNDLSSGLAREHLSAFGGIATLRVFLCGEGMLPIIYPNPRDGLCIPMAREIERRGGEVWRGRRVEKVLTDHGKVAGVLFQDGSVVEGTNVAIATANGRIGKLLDPLPPELEAPLQYSESIKMFDFNTMFLLDRPLVQPPNSAVGVFDLEAMSIYHWYWPLTGGAPWATEPGMQLVGTHMAYPPKEIADAGGDEFFWESQVERTAEMVPGFKESIVDSVRHRSTKDGTAWMSPITIGPKIPRTLDSVEGLWFAGDGAEGARGIWSEAAASCGILGARDMCAES